MLHYIVHKPLITFKPKCCLASATITKISLPLIPIELFLNQKLNFFKFSIFKSLVVNFKEKQCKQNDFLIKF